MANRTHIDLWQHTSDGMLMGSSKGFSPRARWSPSESQRKMLEDSYNNVGAFPNHERRKVLAAQMGIEVRQVQVWFQNRRQKERKLSKQDPMHPKPTASDRPEPPKPLAPISAPVTMPAPLPVGDVHTPPQPAACELALLQMLNYADRTAMVAARSSSPPSKTPVPPSNISIDRALSNRLLSQLLARHEVDMAPRLSGMKRRAGAGLVTHAPARPRVRMASPSNATITESPLPGCGCLCLSLPTLVLPALVSFSDCCCPQLPPQIMPRRSLSMDALEVLTIDLPCS